MELLQCHLVEVEVVVRTSETIYFQLLSGQSPEHLVEHVVVPLPPGLVHNARLLQEVLRGLGTTDYTTRGGGGGGGTRGGGGGEGEEEEERERRVKGEERGEERRKRGREGEEEEKDRRVEGEEDGKGEEGGLTGRVLAYVTHDFHSLCACLLSK